MLTTILLFVLILFLVVLVHEFGHFYVAKKSGMRVDEFGFGFPPKLFGVKKGETEYTFNLLPLGGFVKIYGEDGGHRDEPRSFGAQPIWQRALSIGAGVIMNFLLAYVLFSVLFAIGIPTSLGDETPENVQDIRMIVAQEPVEGSPAEEAGIKPGDEIISIASGGESLDPKMITEWDNFIEENKGSEVVISLYRGGEIVEKNITPREDYPRLEIGGVQPGSPAEVSGLQEGDVIEYLRTENDELSGYGLRVENVQNFVGEHNSEEITVFILRNGESQEVSLKPTMQGGEAKMGVILIEKSPTGINISRVGVIEHPWYMAPIKGAELTWNMTIGVGAAFINMLSTLVTTGSAPADIAGPVGIAMMTGTVSDLGFAYVLQFIALISLNLGILNLIPFPALDGGRLAFILVEKIKGSPVSKKIEGYAHMIGFITLILLIILITYKDIMNL
ncbi:MAG: site-2 protease family protein [Candidatus Spechtbacterales bacterium]|nr:site-2 protease family protein [Candidatus Spechtbacterales bacterium]